MTGDTGAAWNDPVKGGELTKAQIAQGADVVYHAAGGTGVGVLQAAADGGVLGIGVDSNQNGLHPGKVLTSMLKRVDVATYDVMKTGKDGTFKPGIKMLGLAEDGVGYAMDDNNKDLVSADMQGEGRSGQGRHHRRQARRARLHVRREVPGAVAGEECRASSAGRGPLPRR